MFDGYGPVKSDQDAVLQSDTNGHPYSFRVSEMQIGTRISICLIVISNDCQWLKGTFIYSTLPTRISIKQRLAKFILANFADE